MANSIETYYEGGQWKNRLFGVERGCLGVGVEVPGMI